MTGWQFNPSVPAAARVYNAMLGGKDNYTADRQVAEAITGLSPAAQQAARDNRRFLERAVRWAAVAGTRQFIDIGAGMPMPGLPNTHEIAQSVRTARVVYVDNDPVAAGHAAALLAQDRDVTAFPGDLRKPEDIWEHPELRGFIDLGEPVAVVLGAVLHFLPDQDAYRAVDYLKAAMAPGSVLIISHATADDARPEDVAKVQGMYEKAGTPLYLRAHADVARFFDGLELAGPGVTDANAWQVLGGGSIMSRSQVLGYGGVGVKPAEGEMGPMDLVWQRSSASDAGVLPQDESAGVTVTRDSGEHDAGNEPGRESPPLT